MSTALLINASPRGDGSESLRLAKAVVDALVTSDPGVSVQRLDLFEDPPPAFGAAAALAKMDVIAGRRVPSDRAAAWDAAVATAQRLVAADVWVFAVPMWNGGLPWPLKQLIDTVTQPGIAFSFDPETGYRGLLGGRRAVPVYTSQVFATGLPSGFGVDFQSTYLNWWLDFVGVDHPHELTLRPTFPGDPELSRRRELALERAREIGHETAALRVGS